MSTVYLRTQSPELTPRASTVQLRPGVTVPAKGRPSTAAPWASHRLEPKGVTTDVPRDKIAGDPIRQLDASGPSRARHVTHAGADARHPAKRGDLEGVGDAMPMLRESGTSTRRRREALQQERRAVLHASRPSVELGMSGSGLDFYRSPRLKPTLPGGSRDAVRATSAVRSFVGTSFLQTTVPAGTLERLDMESRAHASNPTATAISAADESVDVSPVAVKRASVVSDTDKPGESAGRVLFLAAAVAVAFWVTR